MNMDTHEAASILGRKGGQAKSPAKAQACRENGRRGGRPRKVQPAPAPAPAQPQQEKGGE